MYAGKQLVDGSPFTVSVVPLISPLRLVEASSSGIVGKPLTYRVSSSTAAGSALQPSRRNYHS